MNDNELMHYGVKGMRWGVRKARRNERRATDPESAKKYRDQADAIRQAHYKAKAEKKHMRLNKDGSITEISRDERVARGKKIASGIAKGTAGATALVAAAPLVYVGYHANKALWKWFLGD